MPADFDLNRELEGLGSDTRRVSLPGAAAARRRARQRTRNQAIAAGLGVAAVVAGAVFAFAQPSLSSAPDFANSPTDTTIPTDVAPTPPQPGPGLPASVLLTVEDLDQEAGWVEAEPPAEAWPCAPPAAPEQQSQRSFAIPEGTGRIDQIAEAQATASDAEGRLAYEQDEVASCVRNRAGFDLDEIWRVTGVGEETWLTRYWAAERRGEERLLVSIALARSGNAVTSITHGGFAQDANQPDSPRLAEAAVRRLCAETGGACVSDKVSQERVFPVPAAVPPAWLTQDDVAQATGMQQVAASDVVPIPEGWLGSPCIQSNSLAAGAVSVESVVYGDPLDPGGDMVQQTIAAFESGQQGREHYATLVAENEGCEEAPVENIGTVGGPDLKFEGTLWRLSIEGDVVSLFGLLSVDSQVSHVQLNVTGADEEQLRELLTLAGERLSDS